VFADRPDAHATGDGDLALEWRKGGVGSHYCLQSLDESGKFMTGDG